jgi:hypothetical protein
MPVRTPLSSLFENFRRQGAQLSPACARRSCSAASLLRTVQPQTILQTCTPGSTRDNPAAPKQRLSLAGYHDTVILTSLASQSRSLPWHRRLQQACRFRSVFWHWPRHCNVRVLSTPSQPRAMLLCIFANTVQNSRMVHRVRVQMRPLIHRNIRTTRLGDTCGCFWPSCWR